VRYHLHSGLIALHILHHAAERPIYGHWMLQELARHGYRVSCGTLYPTLHGLAQGGLLRARQEVAGGRRRKTYSITARGLDHLKDARRRMMELAREVLTPDQRRRLAAGRVPMRISAVRAPGLRLG
jgi:DNA-binding PadR family transcriptional regulator